MWPQATDSRRLLWMAGRTLKPSLCRSSECDCRGYDPGVTAGLAQTRTSMEGPLSNCRQVPVLSEHLGTPVTLCRGLGRPSRALRAPPPRHLALAAPLRSSRAGSAPGAQTWLSHRDGIDSSKAFRTLCPDQGLHRMQVGQGHRAHEWPWPAGHPGPGVGAGRLCVLVSGGENRLIRCIIC